MLGVQIMHMSISSLANKAVSWFIIGTFSYFTAIILIEVVRRYVFGASSPWGEMTARYAFVYLTCVAASEGVRYSKHIRIDLVPNMLSGIPAKALQVYTDGLILLLAGCVVFYSIELVHLQWSVGIMMPAADVNMAFAQAALPFGWTLIAVRVIQNWIDPLPATATSTDLHYRYADACSPLYWRTPICGSRARGHGYDGLLRCLFAQRFWRGTIQCA